MSSTNITFLKFQMGLKRLAIYFKSFTANAGECFLSVLSTLKTGSFELHAIFNKKLVYKKRVQDW